MATVIATTAGMITNRSWSFRSGLFSAEAVFSLSFAMYPPTLESNEATVHRHSIFNNIGCQALVTECNLFITFQENLNLISTPEAIMNS
jgi:hypothetical protein